MTENQFISELDMALNRLPALERTDILLDIREYFLDGREDGKTDSEIAASLGNPAQIAENLLASYSFSENELPQKVSNKLITIPNSLFSDVDIDVQHGSLFVRPSYDEATTVELVGPHEKLDLSVKVIGDTLFIRLKNLRHWLFMFNFTLKAVTLNVFIPKKVYQSIAMKSDNGRIDVMQLLGKNITVNTDNGRIQLKEIAATSLTAETDNGRITLEKVQSDYINVKTDNGRIELADISGEITGTTDNGRISLQTNKLNQNIDFLTDNGSIVIESRNEPTNITIHAKTRNGKIDVYGEQNSRTIFGTGENVIRLKSGNGRVTVK